MPYLVELYNASGECIHRYRAHSVADAILNISCYFDEISLPIVNASCYLGDKMVWNLEYKEENDQ